VGAFVGLAEKGPVGKPMLITNWSQFVRVYGSPTPDGYLAYGVFQFFNEGGTKCYVVRTCHYTNGNGTGAVTTAMAMADLMDKDGGKAFRITGPSDGTWANKIKVSIEPEKPEEGQADNGEFTLKVFYGAHKDPSEIFGDLTVASVEETINLKSQFIKIKMKWGEGDTKEESSGKPPQEVTKVELKGGNNGAKDVNFKDFTGDGAAHTGLQAFFEIDDMNIVAMPGLYMHLKSIKASTDDFMAATKEIITFCENRKDCFAIVDPPHGLSPMEMRKYKRSGLNTTYAALYYPWIQIRDMLDPNKTIDFPPSCLAAGIYSRTDTVRGVHKAPAGVNDGKMRTVVGVERYLTNGENDILNPNGINAIRALTGYGIVLWGCRTLATQPTEWTYIPVRRLFLFLEKSLFLGTQNVVFEPNTPELWGIVHRNIFNFLKIVWKGGALFGGSEAEAFFIKVDAENNPPETRDLGQLIIEIGVAPVKPAEFVIIRIQQKILTA
jgi:phage tail sheath protein FI